MKTILIVDDDPDFLESTQALLQEHDYRTLSAQNGTEAYQKAGCQRPDLILLDVMMAHDTEGFETARRLREDTRTMDIPIIMITGIRKAKRIPFRYEPDEDWLPVHAVIEKPVLPDNLLSAITAALPPNEGDERSCRSVPSTRKENEQ